MRAEVEIKVKIKPKQIEKIKKTLLNLGAVLMENRKESDSYFTAAYRDFIATKECLRVRECDGAVEITYKGPTTNAMKEQKQFWKEEINLPVNGSKESAENLLQSLNFKKIVDVVKQREVFSLGGQRVIFDVVEGAGNFVEIETIIKDKSEREAAVVKNRELLKKLGLKEQDIVAEPYRDLVLENLKTRR